MRTRADFALPGLAGALVVAAVLVAAWAARGSSAGADPTLQTRETPTPRGLYSARSHRAPVTRTSIPREQQRIPRAQPAAGVASE